MYDSNVPGYDAERARNYDRKIARDNLRAAKTELRACEKHEARRPELARARDQVELRQRQHDATEAFWAERGLGWAHPKLPRGAKRLEIQGYLRAFAGIQVDVPPDFPVDDGDAVEELWRQHVNYAEDIGELLELNLEVVDVQPVPRKGLVGKLGAPRPVQGGGAAC